MVLKEVNWVDNDKMMIKWSWIGVKWLCTRIKLGQMVIKGVNCVHKGQN